MAELLILDPAAGATDRAELDITPFVGPDGPDFGDAQIEAYLAERERGQVPVDHRVPNRQIVIPLILTDRDGVAFADIRRQIQAKVGLFQAEGGWVARESAEGPVYADVVNASLKLGARNTAAWGFADADAVLTLETLPDWYGDEIELDAITGSASEIAAVLEQGGQQAVIRGDTASRCRIVIDENDSTDQRGLLHAFRSRYYDDAQTAQLSYHAEDLTPLDDAAVATTSGGGAIGGASNNVVKHTGVGTSWTPVMSTRIDGVGDMTHVGTYRVFARVYSPDGAEVSLHLVWAVGDLVVPTTNPAWQFPSNAGYFIADLGPVQLSRVGTGTHRWQGQIRAKGANGGEDVEIDHLWIHPVAECAGRLSAPALGATSYETRLGRDTFDNHTAGSLPGKTADYGGTWSEAGDTDDFTVNTTNGWVERTATSDANINTGQYARLGSGTAAYIAISANIHVPLRGDAGAVLRLGLFARYVDTNNWLMAVYDAESGGSSTYRIKILKRISGTVTTLAQTGTLSADGIWKRLAMTVNTNGDVVVYQSTGSGGTVANAEDSPLVAVLSVSADSHLAAGGTLDDGGYGIYDAYTSSTTRNSPSARVTRFDNVIVDTVGSDQPEQDAVIYADGTLTLSTDGAERLGTGSPATGEPVARVQGALPRIPVSGLEERPVELFLRTSTGDIDQLTDDIAEPDITAQVFYRPTYLFLPDDDAS